VADAAKEALRILHEQQNPKAPGSEEGDGGTKKAGPAVKLTLSLLPEEDQNIKQALALAQEIAKSDKKGHLFDLMATSFLASNVDRTPIGLLKTLERSLGVRLIAINAEDNSVVYGQETVDFVMTVLAAADDATAPKAEGEEEHDGGEPRVAGEPDDDEEPDADDEGAL
jgi:hypothetical protein